MDRRGYLRVEIVRCEQKLSQLTDPERIAIATSYILFLKRSLKRKGSGCNSLGGIAADMVERIRD
jgi:hypothetical protein